MTMITTTYPVPHIDARHPTTSDRRPWGFWATLGWFAAAVVTYVAASFLSVFGYALWMTLAHPDVAIDLNSLAYLAAVVSMPAAALVLILAARRAGPTASGYLSLTLPKAQHIVIGLCVVAAYWCASLAFFRLFPAYDQSPEFIAQYRAMLGNPTVLAIYWVALVVTAPVAEEIIFRGFLMRGWSESRLGFVGAIVLSSLAFAAAHPQYNVAVMAMVLGVGLLLGVMRWRSGSTTLTIVLHATWNLTCGVYFAWQA
jgi:membrane protease YdiL (CAAX protease family)